ncbi:sulfotransferase [Desulfosediminicola flagellatus]|uniref:sulfotransferase n=1 Tax=Desulfosediminicola flagellatus TaxID=2569541 RepID=UPI0010ABCC62
MSKSNNSITHNDNDVFIIGVPRSGTTLLRMILECDLLLSNFKYFIFLGGYWCHLSP